MQHFEDFPVGREAAFGDRLVTGEEIVTFARAFDPQPFHLDEAAGRASMLGGLATSGWHACGLLMRMICDAYLNDTAGLGSPGIKEVRWLKPILAGDRLSARMKVREARRSASRPGLGILQVDYALLNQRGETVMTWDCTQLMRCREAGP